MVDDDPFFANFMGQETMSSPAAVAVLNNEVLSTLVLLQVPCSGIGHPKLHKSTKVAIIENFAPQQAKYLYFEEGEDTSLWRAYDRLNMVSFPDSGEDEGIGSFQRFEN